MNVQLSCLSLGCCAALVLAAPVHVGLVISEVVYNEPGSASVNVASISFIQYIQV